MHAFLQVAGPIAAIVICLFLFVLVLLALIVNLLMAFASAWLREKADLVKMLRPSVESVNRASTLALNGVTPAVNENKLVSMTAALPVRMQQIDKKVEQTTDQVADKVIEFRARTVQVQTIVKAFLLPGLIKSRPASERVKEQGEEFRSPGYQTLIKDKAPDGVAPVRDGNGYTLAVPAARSRKEVPLSDVSAR